MNHKRVAYTVASATCFFFHCFLRVMDVALSLDLLLAIDVIQTV